MCKKDHISTAGLHTQKIDSDHSLGASSSNMEILTTMAAKDGKRQLLILMQNGGF